MSDSSIKWTWAEDGVFMDFLTSSKLDSELKTIGRRFVNVAKIIAPVDTGKYRASFDFKIAKGRDGRHVLEISNTAPYARQVENRHRVMGNTLRMLSD